MTDTFADRLRAEIKRAGLTQNQLSYRTELPSSMIAKYCRGEVLPSFKSLEKLKRVLGDLSDTNASDADEQQTA